MFNKYDIINGLIPFQKRIYSIVAIFIVLNCHVMRNINLVVYLSVLLFVYIIAYINNLNQIRNSRKVVFALTILLFQLYVIFISLWNLQISEFALSVSRFALVLPYMFLIATSEINSNVINILLKIYCIIIVVASISVLFQILFAYPISWFAEPSIRGTSVRYASFLGSLTSLGTIGVLGLAILLFTNFLFKKRNKIFYIVLIVIGMVCTLQKAVIVNLFLLAVLYIVFCFIEKKHPIKKTLLILCASIVIIIIAGILLNLIAPKYFEYMYSEIQRTFGSSEEIGITSGENIFIDLLNRWTYLPNEVLKANTSSSIWIFTGMGLIALAGSVGLSDYPMTHNGYADMIFSGGLAYFIFMMLLYIIPICKGYIYIRNGKDDTGVAKALVAIIILSALNMLGGGAQFIHPNSATILWISIFSLFNINKSSLIYKKILNI